MNNPILNADTRAGTIAGTLLAFGVALDCGQLLSTIILAGAGAIVSFFVSVGCRYITGRINRRSKSPGS